MKTSYKKLIAFFISIIFAILIVIYFSNKFASYVKNNPNFTVSKSYSLETKDKGNIILNSSLENGDILLFGSSELGSPVSQNIRNLFPNTTYNKALTVTGAPHVQSLLTSIKLGSLNTKEDSSIVFIISPQWFMTEEISADGFNANFSKLQYYKLLENENLSPELKNRIANRVSFLTSDFSENLDINIISRLQDRPLLKNVAIPFKSTSNLGLIAKDNYNSAKLVRNSKNNSNGKPLDLNWNDMEIIAEEQGKTAVSNSFMIEDKYYDKYIVPNLESLKGKDSNVNLFNSKEFTDFNILLDLCSELNIKPYFVFASTNGHFYDYTGLSKEHRDEYYDKVENMTKEHNFDYLDLRNYEYENYFYYDSMHLGWKGWLYISEEISNHFK